MLCAPCNRRWPFSYHTKWRTSSNTGAQSINTESFSKYAVGQNGPDKMHNFFVAGYSLVWYILNNYTPQFRWIIVNCLLFTHFSRHLDVRRMLLFLIKEVFSALMLCAPSNHRWPFLYHTKMADFEYFPFLSIFSWKSFTVKLRKVYWIWQVATFTSMNHNLGAQKELSCRI